jgi:hypothetical protein
MLEVYQSMKILYHTLSAKNPRKNEQC